MQPRGSIISRIIHGTGLLTAVLGLTVTASAAPALGTAKKGSQSTAREAEELHKAKHLLERADRDYDGHRVKAIEDIDKAIHALHHHSGQQKSQTSTTGESGAKKGTAKTSTASKTSSGGKEKQAESDRQLREAIHILREVEKQLHAHHQSKGGGQQSGGQQSGGQHSKVAADVKQAIHELEVALSIK